MPAIGEHRINPTTGKTEVWGGDNYGYQSPESYRLIDNIPGNADPAKEDVDAAVNNRTNREKFLGLLNIPNTIEAWSNEADGIQERTGYVEPSFEGAYSNINPSAAFGSPFLPATTKWKNKETGEIEEKPGFSAGPVADQMAYGGTFGIAKSLANLFIAGAGRIEGSDFFNDRGWNPIGPPVDPASTPLGKVIEDTDRAIRKGSPGLELPEDRPADAAFAEDLGGEFVSTAVGTGLALRTVKATAFTGGAFQRLSPAMQKFLRWGSGVGIESGVSTTAMADQNLGGNLANLTGGPLAITSQDDIWSAWLKSLPLNFALEGTLAGGFAGAQKGVTSSLNATLPNVAQQIRQRRAISEFDRARVQTEEWDLQEQIDDGVYAFKDEPKAPKPEPEQPTPGIEVDLQEGKVTATPAQPAQPAEAPAPATMQEVDDVLLGKPEIDTAVIAVDRLGDEQLRAIDPEQPILDQLEGQLQQQQDLGPDTTVFGQDTYAPRGNVADTTVPFADQWEQLPTETLLGYANPETSPRLFDEIERFTGRDYSQFTRRDVLDGLKSLEEQGIVALPNRMQPGTELMGVSDIAVDPARFQFKENVNASGQQIGNSLDGVQRWNPDAEGEVTVWQDPADGNTYVINGHNRLAKAKELGIPTVRIRRILASNESQARALGAVENISQGGGTAFDAAKFIREAGITTPQQLEAAGIPLSSGNGTQGLALSRLPDALFQEAVDGALPINRALKLGGSDLSPENMIRVARLGEARNMSERGFSELIDMADSAPEIASDQVDLFGNTELLDTMTIKAELAARVRSELIGKKNLFGKVSKKQAAEQLSGANTTVDVDAAQTQADLLRGLERQFDADKYMTGTAISQLLNDGTNDIANGAAQKVTVQRIVDQISTAAEVAPPPAAPVRAEGLTDSQIKQLEAKSPQELAALKETLQRDVLTDRKRANREARMTQFDEQNARSIEWFNDDTDLRQGRLSVEDYEAKWGEGAATAEDPPVFAVESKKWKPVANALKKDQYARNVIEWIDSQPDVGLTAGERNELRKGLVKRAIDNGEVRPSETPTPVTPDGPRDLNDPVQLVEDEVRLAGDFQRQADVNEFAARRAREKETGFDELPLEEKKQQGMLDGWDAPAAPAPRQQFTLPADVAKSKPRFGMAQLTFESDLDRAAYIIRSKAKKSKGEDRIIAALQEQGYDIDQIRARGDKVKAQIQDQIQEQTGSRRAPQEAMELQVANTETIRSASGINAEVADDIGPEWWSWQDRGRGKQGGYVRDRAELQEDLTKAMMRVAGTPDGGFQLVGGSTRMDIGSEWGKAVTDAPVNGWYDSIQDLIVVSGVDYKSGRSLLSTAYHEAFHRLQYQVLSKKDMNVLNSFFGRLKLGNLDDMRPKKLLETQAVAFQNYAEIRSRGIQPNEALIKQAFIKAGIAPGSLTGKALKVLLNTWETIVDTLEKVNNLARGNGYRTVYDLFDDAFSGKLKDRRKWVKLQNDAAELDMVDYEYGRTPYRTSDKEMTQAKGRAYTLLGWRNNAEHVLKRNQEFFASEIESLKKQARSGGC